MITRFRHSETLQILSRPLALSNPLFPGSCVKLVTGYFVRRAVTRIFNNMSHLWYSQGFDHAYGDGQHGSNPQPGYGQTSGSFKYYNNRGASSSGQHYSDVCPASRASQQAPLDMSASMDNYANPPSNTGGYDYDRGFVVPYSETGRTIRDPQTSMFQGQSTGESQGRVRHPNGNEASSYSQEYSASSAPNNSSVLLSSVAQDGRPFAAGEYASMAYSSPQPPLRVLSSHQESSRTTDASPNHYEVDNDGICACRCGKTFKGAPKNANANRKRHIETKSQGAVHFQCPYRDHGCRYIANRKDNVVAHYQRSCRYRPSRFSG